MKRVKATGNCEGLIVEVLPAPADKAMAKATETVNKIDLAIREIAKDGRVIESECIWLTRSQVRRLIRHLQEACDE